MQKPSSQFSKAILYVGVALALSSLVYSIFAIVGDATKQTLLFDLMVYFLSIVFGLLVTIFTTNKLIQEEHTPDLLIDELQRPRIKLLAGIFTGMLTAASVSAIYYFVLKPMLL